MSPRHVLASVLLLVACDPPHVPALTPTLALRCEHPDAWFEGIYPCTAGTCAYPADRPLHPGALRTELPVAEWDGPSGAAQLACADACVGSAEPDFFYQCPETGWHITTEPTRAPPRHDVTAHLADLLDPTACFPDSLCTATFAAPIGTSLRRPSGPTSQDPGARSDLSSPEHLGALARSAALPLQGSGAPLPVPLRGRAGYSAGACDAPRCPFYLADLQLDGGGAHGRTTLGPLAVELAGLRVELMQPALGVHTPASGALEFPVGTLDLRIRALPSAGDRLPSGALDLRLRNPVPVRGHFAAGALRLTAELPDTALGSARLDLEFTPFAHPPVAAFDPPPTLHAGPAGLALPRDPHAASDLHAARDPDGDLAALHWVVDGVPGARTLPPGEHDVTLWVADRRGALARSPQRTIIVAPR